MFENLSIAWLIALIILSILYFILWIATLVSEAKRKHWIFFVLTLIFNIFVLIYWLVYAFDKSFRRKRR